MIDFLKPNIESLNGNSTVWIKFRPSLDHFYVGIYIIVAYKSEGAPVTGSSPKLGIFITLPSGKPYGILILTFSNFVVTFLPLQTAHDLVTCFPEP